MAKGLIDALIDMDALGSDARRALLRAATDGLMVAPDRYSRKDMVLFDLLFSRAAQTMDQSVRRILALALIRAGAREAQVRAAMQETPSPNERILRRSVMQTQADILSILIENADPLEAPPPELGDEGGMLSLSDELLTWLFYYQVSAYRAALSPRLGDARATTLARNVLRLRGETTAGAMVAARDEVVTARRTVRDWARRQSLSGEILVELLEARAMTEFVFALMTMFDLDAATALRALNDPSLESLAIVMKAGNVRRAAFTKIVTGFRYRRTDEGRIDRLLPLYDRLPTENAERVMRFWRLRVAESAGDFERESVVGAVPAPAAEAATDAASRSAVA